MENASLPGDPGIVGHRFSEVCTVQMRQSAFEGAQVDAVIFDILQGAGS